MDVALQVPVVGLPWKEFALLVVTALAGGAFGAAIGALPAFIFTGFLVFLGEGVAILQRGLADTVGALPPVSTQNAAGITGVIGFGAVTGPHIAFAGGVAASAYAGKKYPEMEPDGWDYHFGKDILYAFGTKPDVLAVGAVFGLLGMVIRRVGEGVVVVGGTRATDMVAVSVVATAFLARIAFGYPLVGGPGGSGYLDMSPSECEEPRTAADGGEVAPEHRGRLTTEPLLPSPVRVVRGRGHRPRRRPPRRLHLPTDRQHLPSGTPSRRSACCS